MIYLLDYYDPTERSKTWKIYYVVATLNQETKSMEYFIKNYDTGEKIKLEKYAQNAPNLNAR